MKRLPVLAFVLFILTAWAFPALAAPVGEVTTFGFTPERNRDGLVEGTAMVSSWYHFGGPSYSQPLILSGDRWGSDLAGKLVVITVEGNRLNGYICPEKQVYLGPDSLKMQELDPVWSVKLSGSIPTKSHPTYYEWQGRKYIYIGTYSNSLDIIDVTDFYGVSESSKTSFESLDVTDITSAPLVLTWRGHEIIVATSGNTGKILVVADPHDKNKKRSFFINAAGYGRTSSSPAPVDGGRGFAVGVDQGRSRGELQIYYLDDILTETRDGRVEPTGGSARVVKKTNAGIAASFSVDGNMLYFGDTQSNVYAYNTATHTPVWKNNKNQGIFSNRSPALTGSRVYFPAVSEKGESGKILAIDRATGHTAWAAGLGDRAMTAPVIMRAANSAAILAGKGNGELALLDPNNGEAYSNPKVAVPVNLSDYASGVTGEISAARDMLVVTTEQGVVAFSLTDINFAAVSIDDGIPEGEKAEPGQTYTGTATFKYNGLYNVEGVGIGVFANDKYLALKDTDGNELPKIIDTRVGKEFYGLKDLKPGDEITVTFDYTVPNGPLTLTAVININKDPLTNLYNESTFDDNEVSIKVPVNIQNLRVKILKYPDKAKPGDPVSVGARVINESGEMLVTRLVAKVNGRVVKNIDNFDIIQQQDVAVEFTMPDDNVTNVTVEFIVNPDRDRPAGESNWADNSASCTIAKVAPPWSSEGRIKVRISAPARVEPFKRWDFSVKISGYLPPPPPDSDQPPYANVSLKVTGHSENMEYRYSGGTWGDIIITRKWPVNFNREIHVKVTRGEFFEKTRHFTFPSSSGYPGRDYSIPLYAEATWKAPWDEIYSGEDSAAVVIHLEPLNPYVKQTR